MKYLNLILLFSLPAFAQLKALECSKILTKVGCSEHDGFFVGDEERNFALCQISTKGYKLEIRTPKGKFSEPTCNYSISPKGFKEENPKDSRSYSLGFNGRLGVSVVFPGQMPEGTGLSRTTGAKSFFFFPKTQENKLFLDPLTKEVAFETQNGAKVYFNPENGLINESKTTDLEVEQRPIKANTAGVIIRNPKVPMLTFPYQTGSNSYTKRNIDVILEKGQKACRVPAKKLFTYVFSCNNKAPCECSPGQFSCTATAEESSSFKRSLIDGIELKKLSLSEQSQLLQSNNCSGIELEMVKEFIPTQKAQALEPKSSPKVVIETPDDKQVDIKVNPEPVSALKGKRINIEKKIVTKTIEKKAPEKSRFVGHNPHAMEDKLFNDFKSPKVKTPNIVMPKVLELTEPVKTPVLKLVDRIPNKVEVDEVNDVDKVVQKTNNQCQQKLVEFFGDEVNRDLVNEYVKIQSKIALHRVAWTYLKHSQGDTKNFESSIKGLLIKRDPELHKRFVNSKKFSRNERLLSIMSELKKVSTEFASPENDPYTIKYSDVKMIDLLVEAERQHGRSYDSGIMDFTSIIRNSMKGRLNTKVANSRKVETQLRTLNERKEQLDNKLMKYLSKFDCKTNMDFGTCGPKQMETFNIGKGLEQFESLIDSVYEKEFEKEKELKNNFRWNTYWLHVR